MLLTNLFASELRIGLPATLITVLPAVEIGLMPKSQKPNPLGNVAKSSNLILDWAKLNNLIENKLAKEKAEIEPWKLLKERDKFAKLTKPKNGKLSEFLNVKPFEFKFKFLSLTRP